MIPEEDPATVEREIRDVIAQAAATRAGIRIDIKRLLLAHPLKPLPGNAPLGNPCRAPLQGLATWLSDPGPNSMGLTELMQPGDFCRRGAPPFV